MRFLSEKCMLSMLRGGMGGMLAKGPSGTRFLREKRMLAMLAMICAMAKLGGALERR